MPYLQGRVVDEPLPPATGAAVAAGAVAVFSGRASRGAFRPYAPSASGLPLSRAARPRLGAGEKVDRLGEVG